MLVPVNLFPFPGKWTHFNPNRLNSDDLKIPSQIFTWVTREQILKMYTFDTFTNKDNLVLIKINRLREVENQPEEFHPQEEFLHKPWCIPIIFCNVSFNNN